MSDIEAAVEQFLDDADAVYSEYDSGYVDADAALDVLDDRLDTLRAAVEGGE